MKLFSPARIHLGFIELDSKLPRIFGSIGLTISKFKFNIKIISSENFEVITKCSLLKKRIMMVLNKFEERNIKPCKLIVKEIIPSHVGLGSGTQLSLSVGYLISKFNNLNMSVEEIAIFLKRGNRSGIGIQSFQNGGLAVDLGKKKNSNKLPLNLLNLKWPTGWKIILIFDVNTESIYGNNEKNEFKRIQKKIVKNTNYSALLFKIIPGILEHDFKSFSEGIETIQSYMSKIFYNSYKKYSSNNIAKMFHFLRTNKISGFGQTSWGPTGFVFCETLKKRNELLKSLEQYINLNQIDGISLVKVEGRNRGKILLKGN